MLGKFRNLFRRDSNHNSSREESNRSRSSDNRLNREPRHTTLDDAFDKFSMSISTVSNLDPGSSTATRVNSMSETGSTNGRGEPELATNRSSQPSPDPESSTSELNLSRVQSRSETGTTNGMGQPGSSTIQNSQALSPNTVKCGICANENAADDVALALCNHKWCRACIRNHYILSMNPEGVFPPECCGRHLSSTVSYLLDDDIIEQYEKKVFESNNPDRASQQDSVTARPPTPPAARSSLRRLFRRRSLSAEVRMFKFDADVQLKLEELFEESELRNLPYGVNDPICTINNISDYKQQESKERISTRLYQWLEDAGLRVRAPHGNTGILRPGAARRLDIRPGRGLRDNSQSGCPGEYRAEMEDRESQIQYRTVPSAMEYTKALAQHQSPENHRVALSRAHASLRLAGRGDLRDMSKRTSEWGPLTRQLFEADSHSTGVKSLESIQEAQIKERGNTQSSPPENSSGVSTNRRPSNRSRIPVRVGSARSVLAPLPSQRLRGGVAQPVKTQHDQLRKHSTGSTHAESRVKGNRVRF